MEEEIKDNEIEEDLDVEVSEDDSEYAEEEEDLEEELFKENPLKAIWIKLKELEESIMQEEPQETQDD